MKKSSSTIFTLAVALSCSMGCAKPKKVDTRPASEKGLIREINIADSTYTAQYNDITKKESYDKSVKRISDFITNDLKAKADNWEARVENIELLDDSTILLELITPRGTEFDEKIPTYDAIALRSFIKNDEKLKNLIKPLIKLEDVIVSGRFVTNRDNDGNIFFNAYSSSNKIDNPVFEFIITDIKSKY